MANGTRERAPKLHPRVPCSGNRMVQAGKEWDKHLTVNMQEWRTETLRANLCKTTK